MRSRLLLVPLCSVALMASVCACDDDHDHGDGPGALNDDEISAAFEQAYVDRDLKGDSARCSGVVVPDGGPFAGKVALTFDDGPNPDTTPVIMQTLRDAGVPATFFINGRRVNDAETRAIVEEIVEDPLFLLANHTWSHPQMTQLTADAVGAQIDKTTAVIEAAEGKADWFRFPFGASSCATAEQVESRGYTIAGWHIDSADWCYARGGTCRASTFRHVDDDLRDDMQGWVMKQVPSKNGGILLFHDIHQHTADALPGIIEALKDGGYAFTNIDDAETFPALNGIVPPFVGSACTSDSECSWDADGFCHLAGICTQHCQGYCPDHPAHAPTFCTADPAKPEEPDGICVSKAGEDNEQCASQQGTERSSADRFKGSSSAPAAEAEVCLPKADG